MKRISVLCVVLFLPSLLEAQDESSESSSPQSVTSSISNFRQTLSSLLTSSSSPSSIVSSLSSSPNIVERLASQLPIDEANFPLREGSLRSDRPFLSSDILRGVGFGEAVKAKKDLEGRRFCPEGKTYQITSEADMFAVAAAGEEECLYRVGLAPLKPPLGIYFGKVLKAFNSDKFNDQVEELWGGKLAFKSQCRKEESKFYMVLNFVANDLNMPALMYVGKLLDAVSGDDYDDGESHLFVDYTPDMTVVCPLEHGGPYDRNFNMGIVNDMFGFSSLIDVVRYVGDTADGGHIMLGKTFARNPLNFPGDGDRAIAFWYVVNYDDDAFPPMPTALGPIPETFSYRHLDPAELAATFIDFSRLVKSPVSTAEVLIDTIIRLPMGLPALSQAVQDSQRQFRTAGTLESGIGVQKNAPYDDGLSWDYQKAGRVSRKS
eukprot:GHVS01090743.1.p1 GENE.GHVS01090743.1~~GHVS01090743.1.p1  ORF type:complete len:433 (+),score=67.36 GHVS01090743.1:1677-2975(+)